MGICNVLVTSVDVFGPLFRNCRISPAVWLPIAFAIFWACSSPGSRTITSFPVSAVSPGIVELSISLSPGLVILFSYELPRKFSHDRLSARVRSGQHYCHHRGPVRRSLLPSRQEALIS